MNHQVNLIPSRVELFGRTVLTNYDPNLNRAGNFGEARYGANQIALFDQIRGIEISEEELKLTYLHEMLHFILNFTGYQTIIQNGEHIDLEQFIELLASGIYQYEKSAQYEQESGEDQEDQKDN